MDKKISVVVPTHNRKEILEKTLLSLLQQSIDPHRCQIIVIDDGSTDGTEERIRRHFGGNLEDPILFLRQSNKGANAARNLGIENAKADIILILNDDTIPGSNLLELHLHEHSTYPREESVVLGNVDWSPETPVTPFVNWLTHGGPQFVFHQIKGQREVSWHYLVTANVSVKRTFVLGNGLFDEHFLGAHEDTEFAWRAHKNGMRLIYCEPAVAYHLHPQTFIEVAQKMVLVGEMTRLLIQKHPELTDHFKKSLRQRWMFSLLMNDLGIGFWRRVCMEMEGHFIIHRLFTEVLRYYYLQGYFNFNVAFPDPVNPFSKPSDGGLS